MLDELKLLLGIARDDRGLDEKLQWILDFTKERLRLLLGGMEPPDELNYIIVEVSVIRFNRIGSEGLTAHTVEGESLSFSADDFAGYMGDIQAYLNTRKGAERGKVKFL